jgi:hypothetical protein
MKRLILIVSTTFILNGLMAQSKPFSLDYSFYRLDNIDSLNKNSLDSLTGELQYVGITNDSISGLIFPVVIYKTYDDWTKDNLFRFILVDTFFVDHLVVKGKLINCDDGLTSDLNYYKTDRMNYKNLSQINYTLRVNIDIKKDSILINDKLFKVDKTGRIFQRFTGY